MVSRSTRDLLEYASWDVIVIGAGAAGLMSCLEIPINLNVLLLNRNTSKRSSSRWAQGGIAAVTNSEDSASSHAEDTIQAGAGLCDEAAVRMFVAEAPKCVERLQELGMQFDRESNQLATTLEAAHSHKRVLHVKDRTGRALVEVLQEQIEQRPNLLDKRGVRVTQLWVEDNKCIGVQVLDGPNLFWIRSRAVVLASGGGGHLFANTTNPAQACGEGLALAWKAGALIEDLEFVQFHPTALKVDGAACFLLSEALRGEGAKLVDAYGYSPVSHLKGGDLASRDQVSRALVERMKSQMVENMALDIRHLNASSVESRFPTILQRCREFGIDPLKELIPVAPAAHYWMGGVATDLNALTTLIGLYAVGEVACTGLHGANRLASNSLMECLVFARKMASIELENSIQYVQKLRKRNFVNSSSSNKCSRRPDSLMRSIEDLRILCWNQAGVNRSFKGMNYACMAIQSEMQSISNEPLLRLLNDQSSDSLYTFDEDSRRDLNLLLDLNHRQIASSLMINACLFRRESRGGHFRADHSKPLPFWECHSIQKLGKSISTRPLRV